MVNKETVFVRERTYPFPTFESYTQALAATAEADLASFLYQEGEETPDFEHDITLWMKAVDLGKDSGNLSARIETRQGLGRTYTLSTAKYQTETGEIDESTPDGILTALAVTKAKLITVRPLMEDVYPALAWEADAYIKCLDDARDHLLSPKTEKGRGRLPHYHSVSDLLSDLFSSSSLNRRYAGVSLLVLASLVLASCQSAEPTHAITPDVEPTRPRVTEVTPLVTKVTPSATIVRPSATPTPEKVTPTDDPATPTSTITVMPTVTVSPEVSPTPEGYRVAWMPETPQECAANKIRWEHLQEDLQSLLQLERASNVITSDNIQAYFREQGFVPAAGAQPVELNNLIILNFQQTQENGSFFISCSELEMPSGVKFTVLGVPYKGKDGQIHILHFAASQTLWETYQVEQGMLEARSLNYNYPFFLDGTANHVFGAQMLGGANTGISDYSAERYFPGFPEVRQIVNASRDTGFFEAANREFSTLGTSATATDWEIIENTLIPVMWISTGPTAP